MAKKAIALLLLICIFSCLVSGCKAKITAEEAAQIVLTELGENAQIAGSAHVHSSTYGGKNCYNVFITVGEESLLYIVSDTGTILAHGPSEPHSH